MTSDTNWKVFKALRAAIQENNRINDAKWDDWTDANHISSTYEIETSIFVDSLLDLCIHSGEPEELARLLEDALFNLR